MDSAGGDLIGQVLRSLDLQTRLYFRAGLGRPFAIDVPAEAPGVIRFHAVNEGSCRIALDPADAVGPRSLALERGDLVLVPRGAAHRLADGAPAGLPARPLETLLEESGYRGEGPLVVGGAGPRSVLVCGHFAFRDPAGRGGSDRVHPLLDSLPALIPLRADREFAWLDPILRHLESEARVQRSGHREIVRRLSEILLIQVLRAHAESGAGGVLAGLADPQLGRVLRAIHERPEADWTLAALARLAGQSRTLFAERFRAGLGTTPMRYLAQWRLARARQLIEHDGLGVAEAARRVGYASESAFHRGFRARFGVAPGSLRRMGA